MNRNNEGNIYSRDSRRSNSNCTFIPGVHDKVQPEVINNQVGTNQISNREDAVVGFLYSISRKGIGEYWPLHLGMNTIGRSSECSIQLKEQSVSERHAVINIKKMKTTDVLIASIRDEGSKNGMFLNSEELDYDMHTCKNGDIITVGFNYQLLLILINASSCGLFMSENFQAVEDDMSVSGRQIPEQKRAEPSADTYDRRKPKNYDGTVDLGGASPYLEGGTKVF